MISIWVMAAALARLLIDQVFAQVEFFSYFSNTGPQTSENLA
jgi:hypothetical protein